MTRTARGIELQRLCIRLGDLVTRHLRMSDAELARRLGYNNASTLWKVRQKKGYLDVERLVLLAGLRRNRMRPNIDWLFTGQGSPMIPVKAMSQEHEAAIALVAMMGSKEMAALHVLLEERVSHVLTARRI